MTMSDVMMQLRQVRSRPVVDVRRVDVRVRPTADRLQQTQSSAVTNVIVDSVEIIATVPTTPIRLLTFPSAADGK